jgi:hypothetical protein
MNFVAAYDNLFFMGWLQLKFKPVAGVGMNMPDGFECKQYGSIYPEKAFGVEHIFQFFE